ncbi:WASH complex subunit 1-like [Neocloeon triangulifer]|uniref:WASH complex subunit 1-like n=1 Tax=Neocloeon triangulifer TaxID=2078957 RepID=UPI00286FA5F4|nr:WASH complex subunit 1-like [Neocloeon triangulifer]
MSEPIYSVPIVHQDLRQEETIVQIADSLNYLQKCANDILSRIDAKLEASAEKLQAIQKRTARAKQVIDKLTGIKKATKVISSAKYPANEKYCPYTSIFSLEEKLPMVRSSVPIISKHAPLTEKNIQEKMQFYHVKNSNRMLRKNFEIASEEGLGRLPRNITSVTSLLLFNTTENPYKTNLADCFGLHYKIKHAVPEPQEAKTKPAVTPIKSTNIETETKIGYYSPGMAEVPELDIPMDLPNLPGIADDLDFEFPSTPAIPPPPNVPKPAPVKAPVAVESPVKVPAAPVPTPSPIPAAPPAPTSAPPPPPPPPPVVPTFVEATSTSSAEHKQKSAAPPAEVGGDMRASLMAAIRQAGGKMKLKSASEKKMENKKKKQEQKEKVVSGDLMADLHAKLKLRRTGISGRNQVDGGGSLLEKVSAMIPPPPGVPQAQAVDSEDTSDWEP